MPSILGILTCRQARVALTAAVFEAYFWLTSAIGIASLPPPMVLHFPRDAAKSDALEIVNLSDPGSEAHDEGAYVDTRRACELVVDVWAGRFASGTLTISGSPTNVNDTRALFPEAPPIGITGPPPGKDVAQQTIVVKSLHNYTSFWYHVTGGPQHGEVHVYVTGIRCS